MTVSVPAWAWVAAAFALWYLIAFVAFRWGGWGSYVAKECGGIGSKDAQLATAFVFLFSYFLGPIQLGIWVAEKIGGVLVRKENT